MISPSSNRGVSQERPMTLGDVTGTNPYSDKALQVRYAENGKGPVSAEYADKLAQAELGRRLARQLSYANEDAATSPAATASGVSMADAPEMEVIRGDKSYNKVTFYGMTAGGQFTDWGSGVSHEYRRSTIDRIDNFLAYLQDSTARALAKTPDSDVPLPLWGFNQMIDDAKAGLNMALQVGLGAPRILTNDYYLPNLIDAGNKYLAERKHEVQLNIARIGGYGMRQGGAVGNLISAGAGAVYVGVEIFQPGDLKDVALLAAGPGMGKVFGSGMKLLTKVPGLGADVGALSSSALRYTAAGSEMLISKVNSRMGLPSLSYSAVPGGQVSMMNAALDAVAMGGRNGVDELVRIPGANGATTKPILAIEMLNRPGSVTRNALSEAEYLQALEIVKFKGGHFQGAPTSNFAGIDGWLDNIPVQLKEVTGKSLAAIQRNIIGGG